MSSHPCLPSCQSRYKQQGPFAPSALPDFFATADPSATLSPSAHFPGALVIGRIRSRRFRGGARRASPVARRVLVTVPPLPPRRRGSAALASLRRSLLPSRSSQPLGLRGFQFRGYLCVHSRCGPGTRSPSSRELRRWAPEHRFPFSADFATGRGGLLQLLSASLSSCCRCNPARVVSPLQSVCDDPYCLRPMKKGSASGHSVSRLLAHSLIAAR